MLLNIKLTRNGETVELPGTRTALWRAIDASEGFPEATRGARRDYAVAAIAAEQAGKDAELGIPEGTLEERLCYLADRYDIEIDDASDDAPLA